MKYTQTKIGRTIVNLHEFSGIGDFVSYLENTPVNRFFSNSVLQSETTGNSSWYGTNSFDEAKNLLQFGWMPDSSKLKQQLKLSNKVNLQDNKRISEYSVAGYQASVPRYLQGIPTNMVNSKIVPVKKKIIVITKDITYNAGWSANDITEQAIKALQVVQSLENKGLRVRLNVYLGCSMYNEQIQMKLCVKKPDERINYVKMAFPLGHPSMLRRFLLRFIERHDKCENSFVNGYGKPVNLIQNNDEYVIPHNIGDVEKFINNILKRK